MAILPDMRSGLLGQVTLRVIPAATLILLAIWFTVGFVANRAFEAEVKAKLRDQAVSQTTLARTRLQGLVSTIQDLARNDLIINGLINSNAESSYLKPFLRSITIDGYADTPIVLTDYRGRAIAGRSVNAWRGDDLLRWNDQVSQRRPIVELNDDGLQVVVPVQIGNFVEGMLAAQFSPKRLERLLSTSIKDGHVKLVSGERSLRLTEMTGPVDSHEIENKATVALDWNASHDLQLVSTVYADDSAGPLVSFQWFMLAAFLIDLVALCFGIFAAVFLVLKPLKSFIAHLDRSRRQEATEPFDGEGGPSEIRRLSEAFNRFAEAERALLQERSEQAAQTAKALEREKELNRLQRQFVAMVCHEFRTPLAIIDGSANNLIRNHDQVPADRVKDRLNKVRKAVTRLTDLIESVLSAARLEAGTIKFEPASHDLKETILEIVESHREASPAYTITTDLGQLPDRWTFDPRLLRQVFSNLIANAIKYSPEDTNIWVDAGLRGDGRVTVSVRDEGPGIPSSEIDRLFDRFFRASTSTGISGTGIGLHIVKSFVDLHGGQIEVASREGQGTTFFAHLPDLAQEASGPSTLDETIAA